MDKMTGIDGGKKDGVNGVEWEPFANENFINLVVLLILLITLPLEE